MCIKIEFFGFLKGVKNWCFSFCIYINIIVKYEDLY